LKQWDIQNHSNAAEALAAAFEKGYKLGLSDGREGIFIDMLSLVEQFLTEQNCDSLRYSKTQDGSKIAVSRVRQAYVKNTSKS
jgi:hypothetical protein